VFIKHLEKIRIWIVLSDGMHNIVGQLHIDAIYHIEDKNRFDQRKDKTDAEENQKRKHGVGASKGRQQGCPICFTLFRPGVFPGAIKVVGIFATAFRKCHLILIIVELGTTTLVLKFFRY
jgi:tRNA (Thr-GGU) A37 N-methylase